jgi:hypothetical protein
MRLRLAVLIPFFAFALSAYAQEAPVSLSSAVPTAGGAPVTASDYLLRAEEVTNIRVAGSTPFHMKIHFVASGNIAFTGEGSFEETWLAPDKWRREVSFGAYHAVEVQEPSKHTFQASSDYEPKRLLLLMRLLLDPVGKQSDVSRWSVEPEANRLIYTPPTTSAPSPSDVLEFNPDGSPSKHAGAPETTWSDYVEFSGKAVARNISVTAVAGELFKISVGELEAVRADTPLLTDTEPGTDATMSFLHVGNSVTAPKVTRAPDPKIPKSLRGTRQDGFVVVDLTIDRTGAAREVEALYASDLAFIPVAVKTVSMYHFEPARLHGTPVEFLVNVHLDIHIH